MKKNIRIFAAALLIFSFSSCTNVDKSEIPENNPSQMANTISEIEQSDQAEEPASSSASKKSADVSSKAPATSERPKATPKPAEKGKVVSENDSQTARFTEPPKQSSKSTEQPKEQIKVQATVPPASSTPAPTPEPPAPTPAPPEPTPEPVVEEPSFDIGYWVGYAQSYAAGVGLTLESSAVDCWDNPIPAGAYCQNMESDIQNRLNRYANDPDITDVWIWSESLVGGSYNIYIGYA